MTRIVAVLCASLFLLLGCVHVPHQGQLLASNGAEVIRTDDAECGKGWLTVPTGSEQSIALDSAGFSFMTWNVYKAQGETWPEEFARLSAGRDLILLQEALLTRPFRALLEQSPYQWSMARAFDYKGAETGVLTASEIPASSACLSRTLEPLIRTPKSALLTRYPLNGSGEELWVANLHGVNFTLGTMRFREQLETLAGVLESHRGPLILAGDFNNWSRRRSEILNAITHRLRLSPLRLAEDKRSRHWGYPVDLVFYRGIEVVEAESIEVSSSDQNPVGAQFRVPGYLGRR